jgi:hypothetical protein
VPRGVRVQVSLSVPSNFSQNFFSCLFKKYYWDIAKR